MSWHDTPRYLRDMYRQSDTLNFGLISAGIGFFGLLALFPALTAIVMIWGFFADPSIIEEVTCSTDSFLPKIIQDALVDQLHALIVRSQVHAKTGTTLLTLCLSFWSASSGVAALTRGPPTPFFLEPPSTPSCVEKDCELVQGQPLK